MRGEIVNPKKINKWLHLSGIGIKGEQVTPFSGWLKAAFTPCAVKKNGSYNRI
ncbi:MAG: hypothetical protein M0R47_09765 [Methylobacter sp.]|uniref:hypothetical protein n=1 Tax=Methylobacter sp. TaxID=2051955 RepID=UPI0025F08B4B|nr:hypothetical protein [Methylobacter sp.]MCK9620807.1 hypothetical protein [Methylobacter sp.]